MAKDYLQTPAWQADRKACFNLLGWKCLCCGSTEYLTCDHIYARSLWRWLQKVRRFHQPLCDTCNKRKGVKVIDYRPLRYRLFRPAWFYFYMVIRFMRFLLLACLLMIGFAVFFFPNGLSAFGADLSQFSIAPFLSEILQWVQGAFSPFL